MGYGRQGWINLNESAIKKLSDADFPYWHWRHIEEPAATAHDGKCEPAVLLQQLDKNHDGTLAPLEFARFVRDEASRKRLSYTICKFPSEWDASDFDQRWGWLKDYFKNPASRDKELALMHKAWLELLQTRLTPLQTNAEQQFKDAQSAHQDLLEEKAELEKAKLDLTKKITEALDQLGAGPDDLALTQGACGGDLLFTETCQKRCVKVHWLQPFREPDFIHKSVVRCGVDKVRFICLWNGSAGAGTGGTADMYYDEVKRRTGRVTWIDTRTLMMNHGKHQEEVVNG